MVKLKGVPLFKKENTLTHLPKGATVDVERREHVEGGCICFEDDLNVALRVRRTERDGRLGTCLRHEAHVIKILNLKKKLIKFY